MPPSKTIARMVEIFKQTFSRFSSHQCATLAAALAYYTLFALPPLLYLLLVIVSFGMGIAYEADVVHVRAGKFVHQQVSELIGNEAAAIEIGNIIEKAQNQSGSWLKWIISFIGVLLGATGVMMALQASLNTVWSVMPDPEKSSLRYFFTKRILSLSMILGLGFLLLVSLVASSVLASLSSSIGSRLGIEGMLAEAVNQVVSFAVIFTMFAALMRYMPDARVAWRDVWVGALVTAVLFTIGRATMQVYLSTSNPAAQLGSAAASLAVILVWVYYSSMIFLFGAEFTRSWAESNGRLVRSEPHAVRVVETIERS
jgi:membrane protein